MDSEVIVPCDLYLGGMEEIIGFDHISKKSKKCLLSAYFDIIDKK
jgi:hypothetical protein